MKLVGFTSKTKNKRVSVFHCSETKEFFLIFKRLKDKDEIIEETGDVSKSTVGIEVHKNILIITTIKITGEAGIMLYTCFNEALKLLQTNQ